MLVLAAVAGAAVAVPVLCTVVLALQRRAARAAARRHGAWWGGTAQLASDPGDGAAPRRWRGDAAGGLLLVGADGVSWRPVRGLNATAEQPWSLGRHELTGWALSRAPLALVGHVLELHADDGRVVRLDVRDADGAQRALGRLTPRVR